MQTPSRDLLVMLKNEFMSQHEIEQEVEGLNEMLYKVESDEKFCVAHELVNRNLITSNPKKIRRAIRYKELRPFRFLLNKN